MFEGLAGRRGASADRKSSTTSFCFVDWLPWVAESHSKGLCHLLGCRGNGGGELGGHRDTAAFLRSRPRRTFAQVPEAERISDANVVLLTRGFEDAVL